MVFNHVAVNNEKVDYGFLYRTANELCNTKNISEVNVFVCGEHVISMPDYENSPIVGGGETFYFSDEKKVSCCTTCGPAAITFECNSLIYAKCDKEQIC